MMDNIVIDDITLILSAILLAFAIITPFLNGFFRYPKQILAAALSSSETAENSVTPMPEQPEGASAEQETVVPPSLPRLSIILTPHDNAYELERNLPHFLHQDYPAGFEIIVVSRKGDAETDDVLKRFASNEHLYTTYIPDSSRYMSRKKLAVTLGVKAAKNEWVVLTDINCLPTSDQWLQLMARQCTDEKSLVIGYTAYDDATSDFRRFERLHTATYLIREDLQGTPYRHNGSNLLFRKSMFIGGDGYRGNLKLLRGEYDFIVNKYATRSNTAFVFDRNSWMIEQEPTDKSWKNKHLFYLENRKTMVRSFAHRFLFNLDQWALHLNYLFILAAIIYSIFTHHWIVTAMAGLALLTTITLRTLIGKKAIALFDEDINAWKIVPYEIRLLWHTLDNMLKHAHADKNDFISHKI